LLSDLLNQNVVNLGMGGARFETYLCEPAAVAICKGADLVILEAMSARSYRSDLFIASDHLGGNGSLGEKFAQQIAQESPGSKMLAPDLFVGQACKWAAQHLPWRELCSIRTQVAWAILRGRDKFDP
jgi:hypothetical protein